MAFDFKGSDLVLIICTLILPPLGVFVVAGCGADLIINVILTLLGYFPGHIHAFYLLYIFYTRRTRNHSGILSYPPPDAPAVFSEDVKMGKSEVFPELNRPVLKGGAGNGKGESEHRPVDGEAYGMEASPPNMGTGAPYQPSGVGGGLQ